MHVVLFGANFSFFSFKYEWVCVVKLSQLFEENDIIFILDWRSILFSCWGELKLFFTFILKDFEMRSSLDEMFSN